MLAESASRTKRGGQDLIGGLDVKVNRNYYGRQTESFEAEINLPFLDAGKLGTNDPFPGVFIRAPVVEKILPQVSGEQLNEACLKDTVIAPARETEKRTVEKSGNLVQVLAKLPGRSQLLKNKFDMLGLENESGDIIAVQQQNVFGTSFHPELTEDARIHVWWLRKVKETVLTTTKE